MWYTETIESPLLANCYLEIVVLVNFIYYFLNTQAVNEPSIDYRESITLGNKETNGKKEIVQINYDSSWWNTSYKPVQQQSW